MIKTKSSDVVRLFDGHVDEDGVLIGARSDRALHSLLCRHLKITGQVLVISSILRVIGSDLGVFSLSDVEEIAFIIDNNGVVRAVRTASGLWNLFFHPKK